jgi:release factor glutamine methyltransferase
MLMNPFRPSEYTTALVFQMRRQLAMQRVERVLEIGTGSGVVLVSALELGARQAFGIDVEPAAVESTRALLRHRGLDSRAEVVNGDMWEACPGETFDLIVANLPHFPMHAVAQADRLASWSHGGHDGRLFVDRFLYGLPRFLAKGGIALMTHNVFVNIPRTTERLRSMELDARSVHHSSVLLPESKLKAMTPEIRREFLGRGIHALGGHWFADFDIVEARWS